MVSDRGGRWGYVEKSRQRVYKALRREGKTASVAAAIANAGRSAAARSGMSRKGAKTRRGKGR